MVAFEHAHIVVSYRDGIIHIDEEDVVDTWMFVVMEGSRDETTHFFQVVQLQSLLHPTCSNEVVEGLADIRRVRLIMVGDAFVASGERLNKVH